MQVKLSRNSKVLICGCEYHIYGTVSHIWPSACWDRLLHPMILHRRSVCRKWMYECFLYLLGGYIDIKKMTTSDGGCKQA